jgi:hypothetical protein
MEKKKPVKGRPPAYQKKYDEQAYQLCQLGAIDRDLASFFKVSEKTINTWKQKYPSFLQSIKQSKEDLDNRVERALFERAVGYSHPEDKIFNDNGKAMVVPTIKHYAPDTAAAFIWLKNRQPEKWRDKKEIAIESIEIGKPPSLDDAEFPDED